MKKTVKLGYIPTRRNVFSAEEAREFRKKIKETIRSWGAELVDIDDITAEGLLVNESELAEIVKKMKSEQVDGLFFPHCNFGTEDLVAKAAKALNKPVLLWGPRDDAPLADGLRTRDTQCGLFATGKVLRRFNIPFTYLENCWLDSPEFRCGYEKFISVCAAVTAFRKTRVLQLGPRPDGFWSVICNEGELIERFNIHTFPVSLIDLVDKTYEILKEKNSAFQNALKKITDSMRTQDCPREDVEKLAALKAAIQEMCEDHQCNCVAIQCWNALQSGLGIMPCLVNGLLIEEGIPVACETDIHGAVTSVLLQAAGLFEKPIFFADVTVRHPENDNAELFWHCGNFSPSLAAPESTKELGRHFIFPEHKYGTGEWRIKDGDVTICRFDGDHGEYRLFVGEGKSVPGPHTKGTYLWVEVDQWTKWERTLVEGPYIHHCAGIHGKYADILQEACKYLGINAVDRM